MKMADIHSKASGSHLVGFGTAFGSNGNASRL
jgi:hypothetical protein